MDFGWNYCIKQCEIERLAFFKSMDSRPDNFNDVRPIVLELFGQYILPDKTELNTIEKVLYFFHKDNLVHYIKEYRDGKEDWFGPFLELCNELKNAYDIDELYGVVKMYGISGLEFFSRVSNVENLISKVAYKYKKDELTDEFIDHLICKITKGYHVLYGSMSSNVARALKEQGDSSEQDLRTRIDRAIKNELDRSFLCGHHVDFF